MGRILRARRLASHIGVALLLCACSGGGEQAPTVTPATVAPATSAPVTSPPATSAPTSSATSAATPTATPVATAAATATATATAKATPVATATPGPTATPAPTATPVPTPTPTPAATSTPASFTADDWPLFGHDAARSGTSNEVTGTHGAIGLNLLWTTKLGDVADSAPVEYNNMLFVTVHNGTTYGISAATGAKVWTFTTSGPNITTSEPAYDVAANKVYAGGVDGKLHRLNPATGAEDTSGGFPETVTLATQTEKDASPLNVANGYVYAQTSGYDGDGNPYVGHVVAINTSSGQTHVFNTLCATQTVLIQPSTCSEQRSGMWSRSGVVVDPDASMNGRVYVATGNGTYNPSTGSYGDSVLSLQLDASSLIANFTPSNAAQLDAGDQDLGSTSPALLPRQSSSSTPLLAVQGGKDGILRLLNRSALYASGALLQSIQLGHGLFSAPAVYLSPSGQTYVYVGLPNSVNAYQVSTSNGTTQLVTAWTASVPLGGEGTSPAVRDGVVYVAATNELVAFDATAGTMLGSSTSLGGVHWESPIIARGIVYCSDQSGNLTAFTIVPKTTGQSRKHIAVR